MSKKFERELQELQTKVVNEELVALITEKVINHLDEFKKNLAEAMNKAESKTQG